MGVIGYGLGVIGAGLAIGLSALGATGAMARQPEVQGRVFTVFIMGSAFGEALALIGFVVALSVKYESFIPEERDRTLRVRGRAAHAGFRVR